MKLLALLLTVLVSSSALAAPPVSIINAWARASLPHQSSTAAYLTLRSDGGDLLTGIDSSDADMVMLHQTTTMNGMSNMTDMDSLTLPAGKPVSLAPGGTHLMVMDMKHPLAAGGTLHLVLHFSHAGAVKCDVPVLAANATGPQG